MSNEQSMDWAIIERDSDGKGFSGISWHPSNEDASSRAKYLVATAERYHQDRVFYVVNREKYNEFNRLEASGMLHLN